MGLWSGIGVFRFISSLLVVFSLLIGPEVLAVKFNIHFDLNKFHAESRRQTPTLTTPSTMENKGKSPR